MFKVKTINDSEFLEYISWRLERFDEKEYHNFKNYKVNQDDVDILCYNYIECLDYYISTINDPQHDNGYREFFWYDLKKLLIINREKEEEENKIFRKNINDVLLDSTNLCFDIINNISSYLIFENDGDTIENCIYNYKYYNKSNQSYKIILKFDINYLKYNKLYSKLQKLNKIEVLTLENEASKYFSRYITPDLDNTERKRMVSYIEIVKELLLEL